MNDQPTDPIRVVGICGSLREPSYTRMALEIALQAARDAGAQTELISLQDYEVVFCNGAQDKSAYPAGVHQLKAAVQPAHGIILGTPVYHGSYSGVLKNALDLMSFAEFGGKILGLIGVSGGAVGAYMALDGLQTIGRALHAWVLPHQASLAEAWRLFGDDGDLLDARVRDRLLDVGRQVTRFAYLHHSAQAQEFLKMYEAAVANPGAE